MYCQKHLSDLFTPVGVYLRLRQRFHGTVLLESNDFQSVQNCWSFIGADSVLGLAVNNGVFSISKKLEVVQSIVLNERNTLAKVFNATVGSIQVVTNELPSHVFNGFFGFTSFDAVKYFEEIEIGEKGGTYEVPSMMYHFFRYIVAFDHFHDAMYLIENCPEDENSTLHQLESMIRDQRVPVYGYTRVGEEESTMTDVQYLEMVRKGITHCQRGDVFQIVLSRQFSQSFQGDDFQVYRKLRSINPSPYLFYFDLGSFRIFGSSPESHLIINEGMAKVHPIAGTYPRSGNDAKDLESANALLQDEKEKAEHIMLVDLARNDLSKHSSSVFVNKQMEVQYFSHVIHLVSEVMAKISNGYQAMDVLGATFPAGTLSGAPKYKALELINDYEPHARGVYGGAIGTLSLKGDLTHAIIIRSLLSKGQKLYYQAGAGVVAGSVPERELAEVSHKLGAVRAAIR